MRSAGVEQDFPERCRVRIPVNRLRKRIFEVSTSAIAMPSTSLKITEPNVKITEFHTARWKKPSLASRM